MLIPDFCCYRKRSVYMVDSSAWFRMPKRGVLLIDDKWDNVRGIGLITSTRLEQKDGNLSHIEVDEMLGLVGDV